VSSSWIVRFSLGWDDDLTVEDRSQLQRHFSMASAPGGHRESWEVKVRSDTAATAVHEVSLMLGPALQQRIVHISAETDIADRVRAARPW
jgi:hypothetical protein